MSRFAPGEKITWLSLWLNLALGVIKCFVGFWANSRVLVADGLHGFTDLVADVAVLAGFKYAALPSDDEHHYGHHKIATLISVGIGASILLFCLVLIVDGIVALGDKTAVAPSAPALICALISLAVKEWIYFRTRAIAREIKSNMLMVNAWNHRTDSITSVLAAVGIAIAMLGGDRWAIVDTVAGIALGVFLGIEATRMIWRGIDDLLDTAPNQEIIDDLREHILATPGAVAYHAFRARQMGDSIEVDLHLLVDPKISVEAGHGIAREVKRNIMETHPEVLNVLVHVEPYLPEHVEEKGIWDSARDS